MSPSRLFAWLVRSVCASLLVAAPLFTSGADSAGWPILGGEVSQTSGCRGFGPAVDTPSAVHGLFVALNVSPVASDTALMDRFLLHDPTVCGANLLVPWAAVDGGPGARPRYDFSSIDSAASPWIRAGKIVNLIVWGVAEVQPPGSPSSTPSYILRQVPTIKCAAPADPRTPIYWDPRYQRSYEDLMRAVVDHYGSDNDIGYIRFGLGAAGEDFPALDLSGDCLTEWRRQGLTPQRWIQYSDAMIRFEAALRSHTQLMVSLNQVTGLSDLSIPNTVAQTAVASGLGLGMQGLSGFSLQTVHNGEACIANWCTLFNQYSGRVPLELQTFSASEPDADAPTGPLPPLLSLAMTYHTQILELYPEEWLVARDPSNPYYAKYHTEYAAALLAAAHSLGIPPALPCPPALKAPCAPQGLSS